MKNRSLKDISLIAAGILAITSIIVLSLFNLIISSLAFWMIAVLSILSFIISFFFIYFLMDKYIYRRIKLLNQSIYKNNLLGQNLENNKDILQNIEETIKDFSALKSEEIKQLQEMEQYRKEFLGDISHELKTPIFNTQGYLETLLDGAIDNPAVNRSYLIKANKNLDRLSTIVQDLVKISELESGELELQIEKFDIVLLIKNVFENHEMIADNKDVELLFKEKSLQSATVVGDKKRIEVVLNNLILNAIKYGKEDNAVIQANVIDFDNHYMIEVTDNGPGIAPQYLPRLFDRFFRVEKDRSRYKGGNGLGLAICKHIVEAHGQSIHVQSQIGKGTTFSFTLAKK